MLWSDLLSPDLFAAVFVALGVGTLYFGWIALTSPRRFLEMSPRIRRLISDPSNLDHPLLRVLTRTLGVMLLLYAGMCGVLTYVFLSGP